MRPYPGPVLRRRAVALGLVGVLAVAGCRGGGDGGEPAGLRPPTSTATSASAPASSATAAGVPLADVRWDAVDLPLECGDERSTAEAVSVVQTQPAAGVDLTVVVAACRAGAGSPARTILVYDGADSPTRPRLRQTLWEDGSNRLTAGVVTAVGEVAATGGTYSGRDVPRCCPDGTFTTRWRWTDDGYVQVSTSAPPAASWGGS